MYSRRRKVCGSLLVIIKNFKKVFTNRRNCAIINALSYFNGGKAPVTALRCKLLRRKYLPLAVPERVNTL